MERGGVLRWVGVSGPDTEEVTSSNLVTPTTSSQVAGSSEPVACFCSNFLDDLLRFGHIEDSTRRAYGYLMKHVEDFYGPMGISDINPDSLRAFVAHLQRKGLAAGTVRKTYNMLAMCIRHAKARGVIDWTPKDLVRAPKNSCPPPNPLTEESRSRLMQNLSMLEMTPCVIACHLALTTGMRRGEVCALQWRDVDFETSTARVRRSIGIKSGGCYPKGTKTGNERDVPLVPFVLHMLKVRRLQMADECAELGIEFRPTHYVIGSANGKFLSPYRITRWWGEHVREWGLVGTRGRTPTFHDLRHTFATVAVRQLDLRTAQSIMGHSSANMTMKYADTELSQVQAASNALSGSFSLGNMSRVMENVS